MNSHTKSVRSRLALGFVGALVATSAWAASSGNADAQARYREESQRCSSGQSNQDRATCMKEAGAALDEARRGRLAEGSTDYQRNALARCDAFKTESDRASCVSRMQQGKASGSVEGGGVIREYREVVPGTSGANAR